ncbi:hypothetical protein [Halopiger aswanensis]|uniref:Uncharacterized protein n=1 Tax=Halopiger aswanensis TaxID=148449 RepID=A0A419WS72_9EURY|nr:hypothetical protein [Halopiger aswanensis]RKD98300.1 hypothetical protein ATJ93_1306 [Halopiger aswanensis]
MTADLPASLSDSWRPAGTKTGESSVMVASITAETTLYEPLEPTELADLAASKIPLRSLFVVDLSVSPSLSTIGVSPSAVFEKAAPKAKNQFVDTVEDEGLVVEDTRDTLEFEGPNGEAGKWYVLDVSYPLEGASESADDTDGDDGQSETDRIAAEANVAVWPTDSSFGVAGGILPLENGVADVSDEAEAVAPDRDRDTIAELVERIDLEAESD